MENKEIICRYCKSKNIKKNGLRETQNRGKIQRYKCKKCGKRFTLDDGFYRMRNSPQKITLCLDLFYRGVSTRKIQEHLQAFYPHNSSWVSIYSWVVKYARIISNFTEKLKLNIGEEVQIDEIEYHRRKSHKAKKGAEENWFIDCIDTKTRFMVSSNYVKSRGKKEIKELLNSVRYKTANQVKVCTTDAFCIYDNIINKAFGYNLKQNAYNVIHKKVNASKGEGFNYPIERLHNSIRERTKTLRGFHGSIESANSIMKGYEIFYNFIRTHQALGACPYELAIPCLKLGINKWLDLIKLSKS